MRERDRESQFDARIDDALRAYADPPPTPDAIPDPRTIALRLLQQAGEVEPRRRWPLRVWTIPAAACVIALAIGTALLLRMPRIPEAALTPAPPRIVAHANTAVPLVQHVSVTNPPKKRPRVVARSHPLPELDVFPTPTPLSPQEQALVAFVRNAPPALKQAVIEDQKQWDEPIVAGSRNQPPAAGSQEDR